MTLSQSGEHSGLPALEAGERNCGQSWVPVVACLEKVKFAVKRFGL